MENTSACVKCGTILPTDKSIEKKSVRCTFCKCPNPNPNLPTETRLFEIPTDIEKRKRVIALEQSRFSQLISTAAILLGIATFAYFLLHRPSTWMYPLMSIIVLIPTIRSPFVSSHWKKTLIRLTSRSQERYDIIYLVDDTYHQIISYLFLLYFTFNRIYNLFPHRETSSRYLLPGIGTIIASYYLLWLLRKIVEIIGEWLGKIISKE